MPEFCTCGAQLPPDALFCHKCGRPQREIAALEPEPPPPAPWQVPPAAGAGAFPSNAPPHEPLPMNFRNPVAVRIAALVSLGASALFFLPYVNWLAAGYFAVFLYRRKTGAPLNVVAGVRIGWMTGILTFAILAVCFSGFVVLLNAGGMREIFEAQLKNSPDPRIQQVLTMVRSLPDVLTMLANFFVFTTCLSMAGGALGAKLVGHSNPPRGGNTA
jgi:hypothetical protein